MTDPVTDEDVPRPDLDAIKITRAEGAPALDRVARCMGSAQFVRLTARAGVTPDAPAVYADMTPADWDALSTWWPDLMTSLMERMTAALELADREDAQWEVQAFEEGDES